MNPDLKKSKEFETYFNTQLSTIEKALDRFLPLATHAPQKIHEAMRYSVLQGGKRIRPLLALTVCEMLGGDTNEVLIPACAVEFIHSYSLIHDDLPCLDNDEFRRGQLTCHKKFGEPIALLAGDALQTLAFSILSEMKNAQIAQRILRELARAAGTFGMVGGQVLELVSRKEEMDLPDLERIHIQKTGQLIKTSCLIGAVVSGADQAAEGHVARFGEYLGLAFQIVDDILDADGFLRFMSAHEVKEKAAELVSKAKQELAGFSRQAHLARMADFILDREQ